MNKRTLLPASVAAAVLAALAGYLWIPGRTPAGQQPLVTLRAPDVPEFAAAFDAAPAGPRLVLLVSPT